MDITGWQGMLGAKGTLPEIVTKLNAAFANVQNRPDVRQAIEAGGGKLENGTPEEFAAFIKAKYERWGKLIQEEGITLK